MGADRLREAVGEGRLGAPGHAAGRYLFVSTISVYANPIPRGADEDAAVARIADPTVEEITGESYGALKALCEEAVRDSWGSHATIVRPGLIVGPDDTTDRFPYWPRRMARAGEVLAPGSPDAPTQFIDVRDLAVWMVRLLEGGVGGTFNATGPAAPLTLGAALVRIAAAVADGARLTWVSEEFLKAQGVEPWLQMPLWLHEDDQTLETLRIDRALAAGLTLRALEDTVRDTLEWERALVSDPRPASPALTPEREAEVLAAWRAAGR